MTTVLWIVCVCGKDENVQGLIRLERIRTSSGRRIERFWRSRLLRGKGGEGR